MARTKQATPLRREVSSEYFDRATVTANGRSKPAVARTPAKQAGVKELVLCVGGIYASLYVFQFIIGTAVPIILCTDITQPFVGSPSGTHHHNAIRPRLCFRKMEIPSRT